MIYSPGTQENYFLSSSVEPYQRLNRYTTGSDEGTRYQHSERQKTILLTIVESTKKGGLFQDYHGTGICLGCLEMVTGILS